MSSCRFLLLGVISLIGFAGNAITSRHFGKWGNDVKSSGIESYDFIIVGGGTAGCTIGSRLSEYGHHSVLVLEAGGVPPKALEIPAFRTNVFRTNRDVIKEYRTVPQNNLGLGDNRVITYLVGRALGGSSAVNRMVFNRGSPHDYDNWANVTGDQSWNYSSMLKFFKKAESYQGDYPSHISHGFNGPITISRPKYSPGLSEWFQAGEALGYPVADPNGPQRISFTPIEYSKRLGRRVSSFTGYIEPVLARPNLKVITRAEVKRIIFDGNAAVGVVYSTETNKTIVVSVNKEIILSAGVFQSPAILMRSGIGPEDVLKSCGIPPVKILPVGMNLHDHCGMSLAFIINDKTSPFNPERDLTPENRILFDVINDGPFSTISGNFGQAFVASSKASQMGIEDWPDLVITSEYSTLTTFGGFGSPELGSAILGNLTETEAVVSARVRITRPRSRGRLTLNSSNIDGDPIVDFNYLNHPDDIQAFVDGVRFTLKTYETTPSFQRLEARYPPVALPQCREFKFRSDDYWKCHIRYAASTSLHGAGTCRMGNAQSDPKAVVDTELQVLGIENLRVADASVMLDVTNSNTQAAVYGIAEKAAEMIFEKWKK